MNRKVWTSPFGLAFIIGSLAALIAGYFTGAGMRGSETNIAVMSDNMAADNLAEAYPDENALIAANREPSAPAEPAEPAHAAPPPAATPPPAPAENDTVTAAPFEDEPPVVERPRRRDRRAAEPPPEDAPEENPDGPR